MMSPSALAAACVMLACVTMGWSQEALTVVPGRIPYLGETVGHVVVTESPDRPGEALALQVGTDSGDMLGAGPVLSGQRSVVEFPLAGLPEGTTVLHCRLLSGDTQLAAVDTPLTRLPPKPHAVQIDNRRRGLLVDGLPFFPFGFFAVPPGRPEGDPDVPPDFAAQGLNLYCPYSSGLGAAGLEHIRTWMDRCAEVGVKVNYDVRYECFTGSRDAEWTPAARQTLRELVEGLRDHPALLSWYIADEPREVDFDQLVTMRRFIKDLDPYHPVTIVFHEGQHPRPEWREVTDVTWLDAYPVNILSRDQRTNPYWQGAPPEFRRGVASMTAWWLARRDRRFAHSSPLWHSPQCFGGGWNSQKREPSAQELRAMTYAGLISGASAIQYFVYTAGVFPTSPRLLAEAARLAQETMELTPFLLAEEPRRAVTPGRPEVMAAGWQDRGMALVIALNQENVPISFQVTLADSDYTGPAEVLFENREVQVLGGVIEDTLDAQGTRAYQIPEGPFPADLAPLAPDNLRKNPSFEEWVNAGCPHDCIVKRSPGSTCFLDARTAVHGRHSLRMTASPPGGIEVHFDAVTAQPGDRYRVSLWARGDRAGLNLRLALPGTDQADGQEFALSREWTEYSTVATAQGEADNASVRPRLQLDGPGTVWVDLLQVVPAE